MSKSKRGKSASANEISKWETELIQAQFNEVKNDFKIDIFHVNIQFEDDNVFFFALLYRKHGDLMYFSSPLASLRTMYMWIFCRMSFQLDLESYSVW